MRDIMNQKTTFVIFSVYRFERSKEDNDNRHHATLRLLSDEGVPHIEVVRYYKGSREMSILIPAQFESYAAMLARQHGQESYLLKPMLDDDATYLVYLDGSGVDYIGDWTEVTIEVAMNQDSYTYNPQTQLYYTTINVMEKRIEGI